MNHRSWLIPSVFLAVDAFVACSPEHSRFAYVTAPAGAPPLRLSLNLERRKQVRPTQPTPVVTTNDADAPEVWNAHWGLTPWFYR